MPNRKIRGDTVNTESPNWGPLHALLGLDLAAGFTWAYEVEFRDRTRIHAYKHNGTGRTIHVHQDGRCYEQVETGYAESYRQVTQYQAITEVFDLWRGTHRDTLAPFTPREWAALTFVREFASRSLLGPEWPSPLHAERGLIVDTTEEDQPPRIWYVPADNRDRDYLPY